MDDPDTAGKLRSIGPRPFAASIMSADRKPLSLLEASAREETSMFRIALARVVHTFCLSNNPCKRASYSRRSFKLRSAIVLLLQITLRITPRTNTVVTYTSTSAD